MKLKSAWIPFVLSFFAIMGLRIYQILSIGNPSVRTQWDDFEMICFIIATAAFGVIMIMSYISSDAPNVFVIKKNQLLVLTSVITAIFIAIVSVFDILAYLREKSDWLKLASGIAGLWMFVALLFVAVSYLKEKNCFSSYKLFALIPTIYVFLYLLQLFFKYNSIPTDFVSVSNAFEAVTLLFFFFAQARLFVGIFNAATFKKLFYFGLSAVLFLTVNLTHALATTMDLGRKLSADSIISIVAKCFLIIYIVNVIAAIKTGKNFVIEESSADANDEPSTENYAENDSNQADSEESYLQTDMSEVDKLIEDIKNETAINKVSVRDDLAN